MQDVTTTVLQQIIEIAGWGKVFNKYGQDIVETTAIGYMLIVNEDWGDAKSPPRYPEKLASAFKRSSPSRGHP